MDKTKASKNTENINKCGALQTRAATKKLNENKENVCCRCGKQTSVVGNTKSKSYMALEKEVKQLSKKLSELVTQHANTAAMLEDVEWQLIAERRHVVEERKAKMEERRAKEAALIRTKTSELDVRRLRALLTLAQARVVRYRKEAKKATTELAARQERSTWECPVCFEPRSEERRPTVTPCGHVFCATCLGEVVGKCPLCKKSFAQTELIPLFLDTL